jgi:hypothetical protein
MHPRSINQNNSTSPRKRKSTPQKSFPRGYKDHSPGVVIQLEFGNAEGYVKRVLSSPGTPTEGSLPGSPLSAKKVITPMVRKKVGRVLANSSNRPVRQSGRRF